MALYSSRLDGLVLPLLLPRKGKGERAVVGRFSVATNGYVEPSMFAKHLYPFANATFTPLDLALVVDRVVEEFKVNVVEIGVEFDFSVDRLSEVDHFEATSTFKAGYQCLYAKKRFKNYVWIKVPAVVMDVVPAQADVTLVLNYRETTPYLEDMLFNVGKVIVPLNPVTTLEERGVLRAKLLNSKTGYATISEVLDFYDDVSYIGSCSLEVKYHSSASDADVIHTVEVRRK